MNFEKISECVESDYGKYVSFLCDICSFEARACDKDELNALVSFIADFAREEGFEVERYPMEKCADFLCIDVNRGAEKGGLMLAHMDTVHEKGLFGTPPVTVLDEKIVAPGVIDCKGGIAIALLVMKTLRDNGYKKALRLLLTSDEEVSNSLGGDAEMKFFEEKCVGFPYALNCELSENDRIVVSRKGIFKYRIDITGISGHSGIHYFECKNPIEEAAHKIIALHSKSQKGGITYSCNVIRSGGDMVNVIPATCSVLVDVRFTRRSDTETVKSTIEEIVNKSFIGGTSAKLSLLSLRPPMEKNDETDALFNKLSQTSQKYGLGTLTPFSSGGGSDSCYTQALGVPSVCGVGAVGAFCHTKDEFIYTRSIAARAKLLCAFIADL